MIFSAGKFFYGENDNVSGHNGASEQSINIREHSSRKRTNAQLRKSIDEAVRSPDPELNSDKEFSSIIHDMGAREAFEYFLTLPFGTARMKGLDMALFEISRTDIESAVLLARSLGPNDVHFYTFANLYIPTEAKGVLRSITAALNLAPGKERELAIRVISESACQFDREKLEDLLNSDNLSTSERNIISTCIARSLLADDPLAASSAISMLPFDMKASLANDLMATWPTNDFGAAVKWLYDNEMPSALMEKALFTLIQKNTKLHEADMKKLVEELPPGKVGDSSFAYLSEILYNKDKNLCLEWSLSLPEGVGKNIVLQSYFARSMSESPVEAMNNVLGMNLDPRVVSSIGSSMMGSWGHKDPVAAMEWAAEIDGSPNMKNAFKTQVALSWAVNDLGGLIEYSKGNPQILESEVVITKLISNYTKSNPDQAARWLIDSGRATPDRVKQVASGWLDTDPQAASTWVGALPTGEIRDSGAMAVAERMAYDDPESAQKWAESISDPQSRHKTLEAINRAFLAK